MFIQKTIILIIVLASFVFYKKTKPSILKILLILLGLSIIWMILFHNKNLTIPYLTFGISAIVFTAYCVIKKKWLSSIIGLFGLASFIQNVLHWKYGNEMSLLMIIPIISFIIILKNWKKYMNEFSIILIFFTLGLIRFILFF